MEKVPAYRQLLQEFRISHLRYIRIAVILFITGGVIVQGLLKCRGDPVNGWIATNTLGYNR